MTRPEGRGRLDEIIHPVTRLSICGLLAAGPQWVEFSVVRDTVGVSDSVLSKQSRILEDAGYLEVRKGAIGRRPRTWFRLTPEGRTAFTEHLTWLQNAAQLTARQTAPADGDPES
ncbi:winged helix-turn-helix domain-containing protein [Streptomyces sp. NPDC088350]|uniref:winged helix-turn-helix domain-containing protein n=1 Tax=Streptomyces sp. NPDC088350 TaxID=3365854 RepID=UPI0037F2F05C